MIPAPAAPYTLAELRSDLREDIFAHSRHGAAFYAGHPGLLRRLSIFLSAPMLCAALFRFSHWAWRSGHVRIAWALSHCNQIVHRAALHPASRIGKGLYMPHTVGIVFEGHAGRNLVLFANAVVAGGERHPHAWTGGEDAPILGDDVSLGAFAVVSGRVCVGDRVRVAPCATLHSDVPADSQVFGGSLSRIRAAEANPSTQEHRDGGWRDCPESRPDAPAAQQAALKPEQAP